MKYTFQIDEIKITDALHKAEMYKPRRSNIQINDMVRVLKGRGPTPGTVGRVIQIRNHPAYTMLILEGNIKTYERNVEKA